MNFITHITESMATAKRYFLRSNSVKMELDLSAAPEEVLLEIFLRMDEKVLVKNCTRVSKLWHRLLSQKSFWIRKCEYNGYLSEQFEKIRQDGALVLGHLPVDLMKVCVLQPFEKNLINDGVASGTAMTRRYHNDYAQPRGYDRRWQMEGELAHQEPPSFMSSHKDADFDEAGIDKCLASSYMWCKKRMEIDLLKAGLDAETLDELRPSITVSEYVANRADCAAIYRISVGLLGEGVQNSEETFWQETKEWEQWE
ncbi:F-box only protein 6, partial [Aphelenchoides avenae]